MDEPYLHVNYRNKLCCFDIDGDHISENPRGNGQRIIILHAISEDSPVIANEWRASETSEGFPKAEWRFSSDDMRVPQRKRVICIGRQKAWFQEGNGSLEGSRKWAGAGHERSGGVGGRGCMQLRGEQSCLYNQGGESDVQRIDADGDSAEGNGVFPTRVVILDEPTIQMFFPTGRKNSENDNETWAVMIYFMVWLEERLWPTSKTMLRRLSSHWIQLRISLEWRKDEKSLV